MSWRTDVALRAVMLVVATALLVTRLLQQDWVWAGLWALGVALVSVELVRALREGPGRTTGRGAR
ncbi:hypothetical protein [Nocardioides euryhalodurans]|uniref:Uncharacterized protein n=1 Tax=Nocardioides euryhalodurans TaxID=2518370 RepID=A0A4P7GPG0_9ACTN|nr:hypothetical protein [Nocardioides euryhalodurans]QBR93677.1 hypothetical protein EXE57_16385 [Nocardioides euryhalodurans]